MRPFTFFLPLLASATVQAQHPALEAEHPAPHPDTLRDSSWFEHVTAQLRRAEYEFRTVGAGCETWSAPNRSQHLRSRLSPTGLEVAARTSDGGDAEGWTLTLRTRSFGRLAGAGPLEAVALDADGERIQLDHGPLTEWFENRPDGLEQGWTIDVRPPGRGPLWIGLDVGGGFRFECDEDALGGVLVRDGVELPYRGLVAFDARGQHLDTWLEERPEGFRIGVDDTAALYPVTVDPVLTGPDWTVESNQAGAHLGFAVASIGDVNGDGFDDVAVSAHSYDGGEIDEGRVWVYHGAPWGLPTSSSWYAESDQAGSWFGWGLAGAGDVNGDGYADLLISAPLADGGQTDEGFVWAYYGSASGLPSGSSWFADGDQTQALFGLSVAAAGDVNGDGYGDVIIGSPSYDDGEQNEGKVWAYYGSSTGLPNTASWSAASNQPGARFGDDLACAGDFDGDGYDDILISAPSYDGPEIDEGRVWRFDGSAAGLPTGSSWFIEGNQAGAGFGAAVAGAGDVNGDGYDDVLIGAPFFDSGSTDEGRAWLFHGGVSNPSASAWYGEGNQAGALFGLALAGAGDVNGDGFDDVLVSAPEYNNPLTDEGRVWLHLGSPPGLIAGAAWTAKGNQEGASFGRALAGGGDVDGDGFSDVIIGAPGYDAGQADEGRAFAFSGSPEIGSSFCVATQNSTGSPASITALYSPSASAGNLRLEAAPVPNGFGLFIHGQSSGLLQLGDGFLCVGGAFVRGSVVTATNSVATYTYDNSSNQQSLIAFAGSTRYFQAWYRDTAAGGAGFNLSNGVAVPITP